MKFSERLMQVVPYGLAERLLKKDIGVEKQIKLLKSASPDFLEWIGRKRLLRAFHRAARHVPHYKRLLESRGIEAGRVRTVKDFLEIVPSIDKRNYVESCDSVGLMCIDGQVAGASLLAESSGFSGRASTWPKSAAEEKESQKECELFFEYYFQVSTRRTMCINTFLLGTWLAGISFSRLVSRNVSLYVTGPNVGEILRIIKQFKSEYDQIIIAGYPPFLKMLVDGGTEVESSFWLDTSTRFIFIAGGEGFSEGWRDYINRRVNARPTGDLDNCVFSGFGAADLSITGFIETLDSQRIRRSALLKPEFSAALFGSDMPGLAMFFAYNPWKFHVTVNERGELEFSTISPDTLLPLIRYNLHDLGGVIACDEMRARLRSFGLDDRIDWPFPFLYVFGRSTGEVSVGGQVIYPEQVKEALFADEQIASQIAGAFRLRSAEDANCNARFCVDVALRKGVEFDGALKLRYEQSIHDYLSRSSKAYREAVGHMPAAKVQVGFCKEGELTSTRDIKIRYT